MVDLAESLSQKFDFMYDKEVGWYLFISFSKYLMLWSLVFFFWVALVVVFACWVMFICYLISQLSNNIDFQNIAVGVRLWLF